MQMRAWQKWICFVLLVLAGGGYSLAQTSVLPTIYGCPGEVLTFIPDSVDAGLYYFWTFGDGNGSRDSVAFHAYAAPGSYQVTLLVITSSDCQFSSTQTVVISGLQLDSITVSPVLCGISPTAEVHVSNGIPPMTYLWSNGQTGPTLTGAPPGQYSVTVTDNAGCAVSDTVTISGTPAITMDIATLFNPPCPNGGGGQLMAVPHVGTPPFTYQWSNGANTAMISGLVAGTYCVTVTDANGCAATDCAQLLAEMDSYPPILNCPGNIVGTCGQPIQFNATASDDCQIAGITYSPANGSVFPLGTSTVIATATDGSGNTSTCSFTVTIIDNQPPTVNCPSNITVTPQPGQCLTAVSYVVNGTDNCTSTATVAVNPASGTLFNIGTTTVTATATDNAGNTATCSFTVTVVGNGGGVTWSGVPANVTINCGTAIPAAPVIVPCTGGNGCPQVPVCYPNFTHIGDNAGSRYYLSNAIAPWTTALSNAQGIGGTLATIDNATENTYLRNLIGGGSLMWIGLNDVILEGTFVWANGSSSTYRNWLTGNPNNSGNQDYVAFNVNTGVWDDRAAADCYQAIVEFNCANVTGISASNTCGACPTVTMTETSIPGNCTGNYTIARTWTATSNAQVVGTTTQTITVVDNVPPSIVCPSTITVNAGQGVCNANVSFNVTAADACSGATVTTVPVVGSSFSVGTRPVLATATDGCGNSSTCAFNVVVVDNQAPNAQCQNLTVTLINGTASISASQINQGSTDNCGIAGIATNPSAFTCNNVGSNSVVLTVTDINGNQSTCTAQVTVAGPPMAATLSSPSIVCGYQVSACCANSTNGNCGHDGTILSQVSGGCAPYSYVWSTNATAAQLSGLAPGNYTVTITDASGQSMVRSITLNQVPSLNVSLIASGVGCNNSANGTVASSVTGGCQPYTYQWNTGSTASNLSNCGIGNYCVTVTDASGCQTIACKSVTGAGSMSITFQQTNPTGCNLNNGSINLQVAGGTAPYTYLWANGATTSNRTGLGVGTYCVTVSDQLGCTATACATLASASPLLVSAGPDNCVLYGYQNGHCINLAGTSTGGSGPYTFRWNIGSSNGTLVGATAQVQVCPTSTTTYCYTVTDANGCAATDCVVIYVTDIRCGANKVNICHLPPGNSSNEQTICIATSAVPTHLNGHVGDHLGACNLVTPCGNMPARATKPDSLPSLQYVGPLALVLRSQDASCSGSGDGKVFATPTGGRPPYQFTWSTNASGDSITQLKAGAYTVTLTDAAGTVIRDNALVKQPEFKPLIPTFGDGGCDGKHAEIELRGNEGPYAVEWPDGHIGMTAADVPPGLHAIIVMDKRHCMMVQELEVPAQPAFTVDAGHDRTVFPGISTRGCVTLAAEPQHGNGPYSYFWSDASNKPTLQICPTETQQYSVMVIDGRGCSAMDTVTVIAMNASTSAESTALMCDEFGNTMMVHPLQVEEMMRLQWRYGPCVAPAQAMAAMDEDKPADCLLDVYPNPFNVSTTIKFSIPSDMLAKLYMTSMAGTVVSILFAGENDSPLEKTLVFERKGMASGTYLLRLVSQRGIECTVKLVIVNN